MGVLVRQVSGKTGWWVIISHKAKRKTKAFPDKETALRFARAVQERLAEKDSRPPREDRDRMSFSFYYQAWLASYVKTHTKATTYTCYETAYRVHLLPFLGDVSIADITREQLKQFMYEKLNAQASLRNGG